MTGQHDRESVERETASVVGLGCSRTHQVDRGKPLYRNTVQQRLRDALQRPYVRILVTPDHAAELVMWEDVETGSVSLFTDPTRAPCIVLAHGTDWRGLGKGVSREPALLAIRQGVAPLFVPLKGIGSVQWQLAEIERNDDESRHS